VSPDLVSLGAGVGNPMKASLCAASDPESQLRADPVQGIFGIFVFF
jgi:hypothetical protein